MDFGFFFCNSHDLWNMLNSSFLMINFSLLDVLLLFYIAWLLSVILPYYKLLNHQLPVLMLLCKFLLGIEHYHWLGFLQSGPYCIELRMLSPSNCSFNSGGFRTFSFNLASYVSNEIDL
eukprot:TRINITY_DN11288_c4_g1_i1.p2 TRINITY_DN11288_c4_g1~~TRINITY_DN11288_c4_g1_i1.p2  ORF type:complete len:119 (-),score=7.24 TRINITY_DN11288_c4_g1_i1:662-1018(-)